MAKVINLSPIKNLHALHKRLFWVNHHLNTLLEVAHEMQKDIRTFEQQIIGMALEAGVSVKPFMDASYRDDEHED